jgi:hypothetical protein
LFGVATKVILEPEQTVVKLAVIDTVGVTKVVVIFMILLVAVVGFAHRSVLVITTETASPLARDVVVKTEDVCPATFTPLIFH